MTVDPNRYFGADESAQAAGGAFVNWQEVSAFEMVPGLEIRPVLGENTMVTFVHFAPNTVVPVHWHDEEQITFVVDGEFEFEVGGEKRIVGRGEAILIPPNVPHGARTYDGTCLEVDVFHPPRRVLLDAMRLNEPT